MPSRSIELSLARPQIRSPVSIRCVSEPVWALRVTSALSSNAHNRCTRGADGAGTKVVGCQNIMDNIDGTIGSPGSWT